MQAEILSIGTELLLGQIVDTNAAFLARELASLGIDLYRKAVVGDNLERATAAIREACQRAQVVLITGGLGPTLDDVTREAIAQAVGEELVFHEDLAEELRRFFAQRGRPMNELNLRQACLPASASPLPNRVGTAPGIWLEKEGCLIVAMPGVPAEMEVMWREQVRPRLEQRQEAVIHSRLLRLMGIGESNVGAAIRDLFEASTNPTLATLVSQGEVQIRLTAKASNRQEAEALIAPVEAEIRQRLGEYILGVDEETLEVLVGRWLKELGWKLAVAESCTGGLLGHRITEVPGSSEYFQGGCVAYANEVKRDWLGVPEEVLQGYGAVSEPTARAMAEGARHRFGADVAVAITGIAGPSGGTPEKPVGLVYIAVADPKGTVCSDHRFPGTRSQIKARAVQMALYHLHQRLTLHRRERGLC